MQAGRGIAGWALQMHAGGRTYREAETDDYRRRWWDLLLQRESAERRFSTGVVGGREKMVDGFREAADGQSLGDQLG